jgi:hypothetical protein
LVLRLAGFVPEHPPTTPIDGAEIEPLLVRDALLTTPHPPWEMFAPPPTVTVAPLSTVIPEPELVPLSAIIVEAAFTLPESAVVLMLNLLIPSTRKKNVGTE